MVYMHKRYKKSITSENEKKILQSTPDNSIPQGKSKKVRVIGSSSYRKLRTNDRKKGKNGVYCFSVHTMYSLNKLL